MLKRFLIICLAISIQIAAFSPTSFAVMAEEESKQVNLTPEAKSAILMDMDTGTIIFEKNSDAKLPPASITKIMTMLLIMEAIDSGKIKWTDKVRTSERAASMGGLSLIHI